MMVPAATCEKRLVRKVSQIHRIEKYSTHMRGQYRPLSRRIVKIKVGNKMLRASEKLKYAL